jgi:hypothetical protein
MTPPDEQLCTWQRESLYAMAIWVLWLVLTCYVFKHAESIEYEWLKAGVIMLMGMGCLQGLGAFLMGMNYYLVDGYFTIGYRG